MTSKIGLVCAMPLLYNSIKLLSKNVIQTAKRMIPSRTYSQRWTMTGSLSAVSVNGEGKKDIWNKQEGRV